MTIRYQARFGEKSVNEKQNQEIKVLSVFYNHVRKQVTVEEEIYSNYRLRLDNLQAKKNHLSGLIQCVENKQAHQLGNINDKNNINFLSKEQNSPIKSNQLRQKSISQSSQSKQVKHQLKYKLDRKGRVLTPANNINNNNNSNSNNNKSIVLNRSSRIQSITTTPQQPLSTANYLTDMNEYKHQNLVEQITALMKQLNTLIDHNSLSHGSKQSSNLSRSTLMMNSVYVKKEQPQNVTKKDNNTNEKISQQQQEKQFISRYLQEIGQLSRLPTITPNDPLDEVLQSLIANLQKQQSLLVQKLYRFRQLQVQKIVKQHLQEKTIQNMRVIYNMSKKQQQKAKTKQFKSAMDIVKFGYTDAMLQVIKQKSINGKK